jgi:hypothetical protein
MKDLAAKNGFELVNVGLEEMDGFMASKTKLYTEGARPHGPGQEAAVSRAAQPLHLATPGNG